ncbi:MAG: hypothetical protein IJV48_06315 [Ruminococcus sp.]|nr:hypothetical protein [Ruminococcus sp.]
MKKVVALFLCFAMIAAVFAVTASALTEEKAEGGYYLVFDDYKQTIGHRDEQTR